MTKKVFISYAHESEQLSDSVLALSNYLRSKGIDSEIDQYEEAPQEGWPKWMTRQIQQADYVLVVCSELFYKRANDHSGDESGLGVKWETTLIIQQLYNLNSKNDKYIPVIANNSDSKHIPLPLQPYTYYQFNNQESLEKLKNRILGLSKSKRPELGAEPEVEVSVKPLDPKERKSMFFSSIIDVDLWNKAKWRGMAFVSDPSLQAAPIAGFLFEDDAAGEEIFSSLKKQFGDVDIEDEIRLSFIGEISDKAPLDYKVHIGSERQAIVKKMKSAGLNPYESLFVGVTRTHEMNPPAGSKSLEVFKHAYNYFKKYYITNIKVIGGQLQPELRNLIEKKKVHFRNKSDVIKNSNDEDIVVFGRE
ncbi:MULTISPECIES: SEFIR domain-containing protein [unclassified Oceanobacter]|uniref:SEFIR domain-containing protein n=1 Tax=unclassified Oceanobacter TaxID=2620260 RepID=UPI002732E69D|nr:MULTISPECIES: SEFIR domain-containing protein [unclassified Oceanobacter]MDP2504228.1 TIR domain-containing protein [Oceanobacter sp. 3_MG-2023]MDP2546667.1 TIR domain-containing protein [Oceanobacter sp. 4_MG-2023]